ncbi:winged helix DNA-binding domain-containing protein [[Eubacterium] cellulosolvens]
MDTFDLDTINHFILQKQHLAAETKTNDILQLIRDIGGLHSTAPMTPYLSLFARTKTFRREHLDEELYIKRRLGKFRCMRKTIYIQPKEMIPVYYSAMKQVTQYISERYMKAWGITATEFNKIAKSIYELLCGHELTANEIKKALNTKLKLSPIINLMCDQGTLIRSRPKKGWRSNLHTYARFQDYFPELDLASVKEPEAKRSLVKQYLQSFGPVTYNDVAWWTGLPRGEVRKSLDELSELVAQIQIAEVNKEYLVLKSDLKLLRTLTNRSHQEIVLLPMLDPYIMGYKDRERYVVEENFNCIFDRSGNATYTILLAGRVIGVWDITEKPEPMSKYYTFERPSKAEVKEIHGQAKRLGKFIFNHEVKIKDCTSIVPLPERTAGGFMTPLRDC